MQGEKEASYWGKTDCLVGRGRNRFEADYYRMTLCDKVDSIVIQSNIAEDGVAMAKDGSQNKC